MGNREDVWPGFHTKHRDICLDGDLGMNMGKYISCRLMAPRKGKSVASLSTHASSRFLEIRRLFKDELATTCGCIPSTQYLRGDVKA